MPCLNLLSVRISYGRIFLFILSSPNNIKEMPVAIFVLIKQKKNCHLTHQPIIFLKI